MSRPAIAAPPSVFRSRSPLSIADEADADLWLLCAVFALLSIGVVEIYSASAVYAEYRFGSATRFLWRHLLYLGIGAGGMLWAARTDYGWIGRHWPKLLIATFVLLLVTLVVGARINSATRWLVWGPLSFQPVELAKIALVAYLAHSLSKKKEKVRIFTVGFVPHLVVCGLMMLLLLKQPDLGSSLILAVTTLILLFVAGTRLSYILIAILATAPVIYHAIVGSAWRLKRVIAFLDPWQYREGVGYQITESLIAIGSGGVTGLGLGDGKQKLFYMPEAHTDFIMSNVGEELGFVGFAVVIGLFVVVLWRGVLAALRARDTFGTYLAFGFTSIFAVQALINTGVVLGALPTKGLTLPFVSYGGSSLIASMFCVGVLINIGRGRQAPVAKSKGTRVKNNPSVNKRRQQRVQVVNSSRLLKNEKNDQKQPARTIEGRRFAPTPRRGNPDGSPRLWWEKIAKVTSSVFFNTLLERRPVWRSALDKSRK